jgi:hypothetical protein
LTVHATSGAAAHSSTRSRALALVRRDRALSGLLLAGFVELVIMIAQAPRSISQIYRSADIVTCFVLPQLASSAPGGSFVDLGNHDYFEGWWFERATVGLPGHLVIWEVAPLVVLLVGVGAVVWAAGLALGRWAAALTAVALLAISDNMRMVEFLPSARVGMLVHMGVLSAALVLGWRGIRSGRLRPRDLVAAAAVLGLFTAAGATDQLLLLDGVIPFLAAAVVWWLRSRSPASRRLMVFATVTTAIAWLGAAAITNVMSHHGVLAAQSLGSFQLVRADALGSQLATTLSSWTTLAGGDFFGAVWSPSASLTVLLGAFSLAGLGAGLLLTGRRARAWWLQSGPAADSAAARDLFVAFWGIALVMAIATYWLTSAGDALVDFRYLLGGWIAAAALIGALATTPRGRLLLTACLIVFAAAMVAQDLRRGMRAPGDPYPVAAVSAIEKFVGAHGARIGYAGYMDAENLTWDTRFAIQAYPIWPCPGDDDCQSLFSNISSWYTPRRGIHTFLVTANGYQEIAAPAPAFGPAIASTTIGRYTVYVYGHDIAAQVRHIR